MAGDITRRATLLFEADTSRAQAQIQQLAQSLQSALNFGMETSGFHSLDTQLQSATKDALQLQVQLQSAMNVNTGKLDLTKFNQSLKSSHTSLEQYQRSLMQLGTSGQAAFTSLARSITTAEMPMQRVSNTLNKLMLSLKNTITWNISSSIMNGFIGNIQSAFNYAEKLNQSLTAIQIVTGESSAQMAKFAEQANKSAQALSTTTRKYTDAALIFYQQGLGDADVKARTDAVIKMANVTRDASKEVSNYMTAIWNNFDDGTSSLESFEDKIVALGATTASSSAEIAAGLEKFAAIGKTVGLSFDYAAAALATVVAETRQSADTVGTAFRTLFSRLQGLKLGETLEDGTDLNKYSSALASVGVQIKDASGQLKDLDTILADLAGKWNTLDRAQQTALAQTVGGARQYTILMSLMNNWDQFQKNLTTEAGSAGELQKQADIYAQSWEAAKDRVTAAAESIYSSLIDDKFFIGLNNGFAKGLQGINNFIKGLNGIPGVLSSISALTTTIFEKQMVASLKNLTANLQLMTKSGRQELQNMQLQAATMVSQMGKNGQNNLATEAYQIEAQTQLSIIQNMSRMSESEKTIASIVQNRIQQRAEENVELGRTIAELERMKSTQQKAFDNQMNNTAAAMPQTTANGVLFNNIETEYTNFKNLVEQGIDFTNVFKGFTEATTVEQEIDNLRMVFRNVNASSSQDMQQLKQVFTQCMKDMATGAKIPEQAMQDFREAMQNVATDAQNELNQAIQTVNHAFEDMIQHATTIGNADLANSLRTAQDEFNAYATTTLRVREAQKQAANNSKEMAQGVGILTKTINDANNKILDAQTKIIKFGQIISTVSMIINQIAGAVRIWQDEDASLGQKLLTTATTLGVLIPMLIRLKTNIYEIGVSNLTAAASTTAATAAQTAQNTAVVAGTAATQGATVATYGFGTALKAAMGPIGWIITGLTALAGIIAIIYDNIDHRSAAEKITDTAVEIDNLTEAATETTEEIENMYSAFANYEEAYNALGQLTEGTEAWNSQLETTKTQLNDIMTMYPILQDIMEHPEKYDMDYLAATGIEGIEKARQLTLDNIYSEQFLNAIYAERKATESVANAEQGWSRGMESIIQEIGILITNFDDWAYNNLYAVLTDKTMISNGEDGNEKVADIVARRVSDMLINGKGFIEDNDIFTPEFLRELQKTGLPSVDNLISGLRWTMEKQMTDLLDDQDYGEILKDYVIKQMGLPEDATDIDIYENFLDKKFWNDVIMPAINGMNLDVDGAGGAIIELGTKNRKGVVNYLNIDKETYEGLKMRYGAEELNSEQDWRGQQRSAGTTDTAFKLGETGLYIRQTKDGYSELAFIDEDRANLFEGFNLSNQTNISDDQWDAFFELITMAGSGGIGRQYTPQAPLGKQFYNQGTSGDMGVYNTERLQTPQLNEAQKLSGQAVLEYLTGSSFGLYKNPILYSYTEALADKFVTKEIRQYVEDKYGRILSSGNASQLETLPYIFGEWATNGYMKYNSDGEIEVSIPGAEGEDKRIYKYKQGEILSAIAQMQGMQSAAGYINGTEGWYNLLENYNIGETPKEREALAALYVNLGDMSALTGLQYQALWGENTVLSKAGFVDNEQKLLSNVNENALGYSLRTLDRLYTNKEDSSTITILEDTLRNLIEQDILLGEDQINELLNLQHSNPELAAEKLLSYLPTTVSPEVQEQVGDAAQQMVQEQLYGQSSIAGMRDVFGDNGLGSLAEIVSAISSGKEIKDNQLTMLENAGFANKADFHPSGISGKQVTYTLNKDATFANDIVAQLEQARYFQGLDLTDSAVWDDKTLRKMYHIPDGDVIGEELKEQIIADQKQFTNENMDAMVQNLIPILGVNAAEFVNDPDLYEAMIRAQLDIEGKELDDATIAQIAAKSSDKSSLSENLAEVLEHNDFQSAMNSFLTSWTSAEAITAIEELANIAAGGEELSKEENKDLNDLIGQMRTITGDESIDAKWITQHNDFIDALYNGDQEALDTVMSTMQNEGMELDVESIRGWASVMARNHMESTADQIDYALQQAIEDVTGGNLTDLTLAERKNRQTTLETVTSEKDKTKAFTVMGYINENGTGWTDKGKSLLNQFNLDPNDFSQNMIDALFTALQMAINESIDSLSADTLTTYLPQGLLKDSMSDLWDKYIEAMGEQVKDASDFNKLLNLSTIFTDLGYSEGQELLQYTMENGGQYVNELLTVMSNIQWGIGKTTWLDVERLAMANQIDPNIIELMKDKWITAMADQFNNAAEVVLADSVNGFANMDSASLNTAVNKMNNRNMAQRYMENAQFIDADQKLTESGVKALRGVGYTGALEVGQLITSEMVQAMMDGMQNAAAELTPEALAKRLPKEMQNPMQTILEAIEAENGTLTWADNDTAKALLRNAQSFGGDNGMVALKNIITQAQAAGQDVNTVIATLNGLDWSKFGFESVRALLQEVGIDTTEFDLALQDLCDSMVSAITYTDQLSNALNNYSKATDIMDKLKADTDDKNVQGKTYSQDNYDYIASQFGQAYADEMFTMRSDGLYELSSRDNAQQYYEDTRGQLIGQYQNAYTQAQDLQGFVGQTDTWIDGYQGSTYISGIDNLLAANTVNRAGLFDLISSNANTGNFVNLDEDRASELSGLFTTINDTTAGAARIDAINDVLGILGVSSVADMMAAALPLVNANANRAGEAADDILMRNGNYNEIVGARLGGQLSGIPQEQYDNRITEAMTTEMGELGFNTSEFQEMIHQLEEMPELTNLSRQGILDLAKAATRWNEGVESGSKNLDTWMTELKKGNKEAEKGGKITKAYTDALDEMEECYNNILNIDKGSLSKGFLESEKNAELLKKAINGDEEALNELQSVAAKDILGEFNNNNTDDQFDIDVKAKIDTDGFQGDINSLLDTMASYDWEANGIEVGASIDDSPFYDAIDQMIFGSQQGAEAMSNALSAVGVDAQVVEHTVDVSNINEQITPSGSLRVPIIGEDGQISGYEEVAPQGSYTLSSDGSQATYYTLEGATYNGGGLKTPKGGSGGGGRRGGGGGRRGGGSRGRRSTGDKKKKENRYVTNTNQLEDLQDTLEKINKVEERAYGKDKIKQMQQKAKVLEEIAKKQHDLYEEAVKYTDEDKKALESNETLLKALHMAGVKLEFDENGTILNRDAIEQAMTDYYNSFTEDERNDAGEYVLKAGITEKQYKEMQEDYQELEEAIDKYDESQDKRKEYWQAYVDAINEAYDLTIEMAKTRIDVEVNVSDEALKVLDFMLGTIEDDAYKAAEAIALMEKQSSEYNAKEMINTSGILDMLQGHGRKIYIDKSGKENTTTTLSQELIEGLMNDDAGAWAEFMTLEHEFTQNEIDTIQEFVNGKIDALQDLMDTQKRVYEEIGTLFEKGNEDMDEVISKIEHLQNITETYGEIVDLIGKKKLGITGEFMNDYNISQINQQIALLSSNKQILETQRQELLDIQNQLSDNNLSEREKQLLEEQIKEMEENIRESEETFMSTWQDAISKIADLYTSMMERAIEEVSDKLAGELGSLEELSDKFDKAGELSDQYVNDYERIYELSKLNRDINNSIDETDNIKSKQALAELQAEINQMDADNVKLTKYQIDNARRRYELTLAQQQLEESKNAKSNVQMTRSATGEWNYVYTADENQVAEAEQDYEEKLYAMQRANGEYINELQNNLVDLKTRMTEEIQALRQEDYASEEEYAAAVADIINYYSDLMDINTQNLNLVFDEQQRLYEKDWENYHTLTGYKISDDQDYVDKFNETTLSILTNFTAIEDYQKNYKDATQQLYDGVMQIYNTLKGLTEDVMGEAETNINNFKDVVNTDVGEMNNDADDLADKMKETSEKIVSAFADMTTALSDWQTQYSAMIESQLASNTALAESYNTILKAWSGYDKTVNGIEDKEETNNNSSTSTETGNGTSTEDTDTLNEQLSEEEQAAQVEEELKYKRIALAALYWEDNPYTLKWSKIKNMPADGITEILNIYDQYETLYGKESKIPLKQKRKDLLTLAGSAKEKELKNYKYDELKKKTMFDTGGYTGEWVGNEGRLAILHSKELVLKPEDTRNVLDSVEILRNIAHVIDINALASAGYMSSIPNVNNINSGTLEQEVHITAEFPNATNKDEIKEAFGDLINLASQYANRK